MQHNEQELPAIPVFFTHEFKRNLRQLAKKYRHIQKDIEPTLGALQAGHLPGDQIPGIAFEIYKVRARNADSAKGKSGGYRIIYQKTRDNAIVLLTIYSKTEQSDISPQEIQSIINYYEQHQLPHAQPEMQEDKKTASAVEDTAEGAEEGNNT